MFKNIVAKATIIKKFFIPTAYDKLQRQQHKERLLFYGEFIKPKDLCFDIGANFGNRTSVFIELGAKVVALEPQEKCFKWLIGKYANKATFLQKGAGAKNEVKDFYISEQYNQLSSFSENWMNDLKARIGETKIDNIEKIEIVTLDSLIKEHGIPAFIKIDVEGYEKEVLNGLTSSFSLLSFEYAVPEMQNELIECLQIINSKYKNVTFNYTIGENCKFINSSWIGFKEIMHLVNTKEFLETYAGDIYVKNIS
jgi:FkbM family methyltransferase